MSNLYLQLKEILAPGRVQIGEVVAYAEGNASLCISLLWSARFAQKGKQQWAERCSSRKE